jgi:CRISPR/Cas system CSM-associated protein Csm3 (group 7 of RAMP superfamily)
MNNAYTLKFKLASEATFGRGDGVAGEVNVEIAHDENGFPYLSGKTLKGMLTACCAEVLASIKRFKSEDISVWQNSAQRLFGQPGSLESEAGIVWFGDAQLPEDLRAAVSSQIDKRELDANTVLELLTTLRKQTAVDSVTGAPKEKTLRVMRVILRGTPFEANLVFREQPTISELALLAACLRAFYRAGTGRNRGRGKLESVSLFDPNGKNIDEKGFSEFERRIAP